MGHVVAFGAGAGDGIKHIGCVQCGLGIDSVGTKAVAFTVDTSLAVAACVCLEVGGERDAVFCGARDGCMASGGEGHAG